MQPTHGAHAAAHARRADPALDQAIRQAEALRAALLDAAPDALVVTAPDARIVLATRQVEPLLGYAPDELLGQPIEVLVPAPQCAGHVGLRQAYLRSPTARPMGYRRVLHARRKDGSSFPAEISLSPLDTPTGLLVSAAIRDASGHQEGLAEQARLRQQAEAAEAKFRGLLESAPDAMVITGSHGRIVLVNRQAELLFGYPRQGLLGQSVDLLLPERFRGAHVGHRAAYVANPHARPMGAGLELFGRRQDGTEFPVAISLSPVETADGTLTAAAIRDMSSSKAAEARLRRQALLLDLVPAAVIVRTPAGAIQYWNDAAEELYGWSAETALGQVTHTLLRTEFPAGQSLGSIEQVLAAEGHWAGELVHTTRAGRRMAVSSRQILQREEQTGVPQAVLEINTDISQLKEAAAELERSNRELEQFAYVASHDLQEPLRMVASYTQLLRRRYAGKLDQDADEFIDFAVDGATRMQTLINDLLAYSRVGTQGQPLRPTSTAEVFERVQADLHAAVAEHRATVTHDVLPTVLGDPVQLYQLLQNLLRNALRYRRDEPPRVHIGVERQGALWRFAVRDNGIGFEPQYAERIFVLFQRLHTRADYAGTGIGLAVCKKIVERHGGRIWAESTPGQGATFFFLLRAAD